MKALLIALLFSYMAITSFCDGSYDEQRGINFELAGDYRSASREYEGASYKYTNEGDHVKSRQMLEKATSVIIIAAIQHEGIQDYFNAAAYYFNAADLYAMLGNTKKSEEMRRKGWLMQIFNNS